MPKLCSQYGVIPATSAETLLEELHKRCGVMVHGRGKHKSQLQRDAMRCADALCTAA